MVSTQTLLNINYSKTAAAKPRHMFVATKHSRSVRMHTLKVKTSGLVLDIQYTTQCEAEENEAITTPSTKALISCRIVSMAVNYDKEVALPQE